MDSPGVDENHLYVKYNEEEGVHVVAEIELAPLAADGLHPALVDVQLHWIGLLGADARPGGEPRDHHHAGGHYEGYDGKYGDEPVLAEIVVKHNLLHLSAIISVRIYHRRSCSASELRLACRAFQLSPRAERGV